MQKVIRDGKVAVAYSPGYGAGWSTWHGYTELIFHPVIIEAIEAGIQNEITPDWIEEKLGFANAYCGGAEDLEIEWFPIGTKFAIKDYDGSEYFITEQDLDLTA